MARFPPSLRHNTPLRASRYWDLEEGYTLGLSRETCALSESFYGGTLGLVLVVML